MGKQNEKFVSVFRQQLSQLLLFTGIPKNQNPELKAAMIRIGKRQNERREQTRADGKAGTHKQTLWRMMRGSSKFFFFVAKTASLLKKEVSSCVFESLERRILIAFGVLNSFLFVLSCLLFMSSRREIDRLLKFVLFFFSRFFDFHTSFFNHLGFLSLTEELKNVKTVFSMVH